MTALNVKRLCIHVHSIVRVIEASVLDSDTHICNITTQQTRPMTPSTPCLTFSRNYRIVRQPYLVYTCARCNPFSERHFDYSQFSQSHVAYIDRHFDYSQFPQPFVVHSMFGRVWGMVFRLRRIMREMAEAEDEVRALIFRRVVDCVSTWVQIMHLFWQICVLLIFI